VHRFMDVQGMMCRGWWMYRGYAGNDVQGLVDVQGLMCRG